MSNIGGTSSNAGGPSSRMGTITSAVSSKRSITGPGVEFGSIGPSSIGGAGRTGSNTNLLSSERRPVNVLN